MPEEKYKQKVFMHFFFSAPSPGNAAPGCIMFIPAAVKKNASEQKKLFPRDKKPIY
jgi:hypothetical protein